MRSLKSLALVVAATALVVAAQGSAAGPTTVSNVYTVGSRTVPGVSTGLVLTTGMSVTVTATGSVCPFGNSNCFGPDGNPAWNTNQSSYGGFVLPGAPAWGLVGRVGTGPWVQVGSGPTTLSGTGVLVFAMNDDLFSDNRGSFTVTVSYACWPGWGYGDKNHDHCGPPGLAGREDAPGHEPKGQAKGQANGQANGQASGQANGQSNGQASGHESSGAHGKSKGNGKGD